MNHFDPVERWSDRSWVRWVFDAAVALVAAASPLPYFFHDNAHLDLAAVPLLAATAGPLVLRRVYPVPVFGWVLCAAAGISLWNEHAVPALALLIALYTVASMLPRAYALACAGALEVFVVGAAVDVSGSGFWYDAIFLSGLVGAALGLGLYAATRRAFLAELNQRATRLEYERDQQGALAAAAERARIAREMHDVVAHHLTVMVALSDGAIAAAATSPERGIEVMHRVSATGRRALADTRRLLGVLRQDDSKDGPQALQPVPDLAELDVLVERVRAAGLPTSCQVHGAPVEVSPGVQLTVYRLVQEALTNTLKHAGPGAHATVRLRYLPDEVAVDVIDDGAGASAPQPAGVGGGLSGMQERVHAFGGDLSAGPGRGGGWRVSARLRLDQTGPA